MKISINKTGNEMAELHRKAIAFDEAALDKASDESFARIDHLKEVLTFQRPDCIGDILVLALLAANRLEQLQPFNLSRETKRILTKGEGDRHINAKELVLVLRLLDAIITGIEEKAKITREDLGLGFLREREDDREQVFEQALDAIEEPKAKAKKAA